MVPHLLLTASHFVFTSNPRTQLPPHSQCPHPKPSPPNQTALPCQSCPIITLRSPSTHHQTPKFFLKTEYFFNFPPKSNQKSLDSWIFCLYNLHKNNCWSHDSCHTVSKLPGSAWKPDDNIGGALWQFRTRYRRQ